ncbi:MAG: LysR substrate-binding domain-containing protein [Pseudomonadota bacterium]
MKRDLEIDLLRSFVAVAAHRNFTKAAKAIGRTQSAVSLQIKRLEEIVGAALFERTRQSVTITPAGEALLVFASRILAANDEALAHIQQPDAAGRVRLGAPDDYATFLLPPILAELTRDHPRLQIEVVSDNASDLLSLLSDGALDVVVATHPVNAVSGEIARYDALHWVAAPDYLNDPEATLSMVLFPSGCVCREIALGGLRDIRRPWHVAYSTRSIGLMEQAILQNASVSVMEASVIPKTLRIIDGLDGFPPLPNVAICVHRAASCAPHTSVVADRVLKRLSDRRA